MLFQTVFNIAMDLVDERLPTGAISETDTADYAAKAPGLLTIIHTEVCLAEGIPPMVVNSLDDEIVCSDLLALTAIPYGLAAHLLIDENPTTAGYFQQRYDEAKRRAPAVPSRITDVYGLGGDGYGSNHRSS